MIKIPISWVCPILIGILVTGCQKKHEMNLQKSSPLDIGSSESLSSKSFLETAEMLDIVHERLLTSKVRRQLLYNVEYSGLVSRDNSKRGYLQGSSGMWTLTAQELTQQPEFERFFLTVDPSERGVSVIIDNITICFRIVDARGRDITHYELKNLGLSVPKDLANESSNTLISLLLVE